MSTRSSMLRSDGPVRRDRSALAPVDLGVLIRAERPLTCLAIVCTGLMAGLFFSFSIAVMPGLAHTDDATFVTAMRSVNRAIQNLPFAAAFVGALVVTAAALVAQSRRRQRLAVRWTLAGLVLYTAALVTTMAVNVPLNESLDAVRAGAAATAVARARFEATWTITNDLRTVLCIAALGCLARATSLRERLGTGIRAN